MEYIMKLDVKTIDVLKNFALISPSIIIKEGNVLTTMSPSKLIIAKAKVPTTFTKRFAIHNLVQFLGSISMYEDTDLEFTDNYVVIGDKAKSSINYTYASEASINAPPEKDLQLPTVDVSVDLTARALKDVVKHCGILQLPEVAIVGDGSKIYLQGLNTEIPTGNVSKIVIGETQNTFKAIFKIEHLLKLSDNDYHVKISSKGYAHFKSSDIEYWVVVQSSSSF